MRTKKKKSKVRIVIDRILISVLIITLTIVVFFEVTIRERLELSIIAQVKTVSSSAINTAVGKYIKENIDVGNKMVEINSDESGNVKSISENAFIVNQFKTDITDIAQSYVDTVMKKHGIKVQLGNFTGLTILSEFGPYIPMDVDATSSIGCEVVSTFESCGVNQTLHRLELKMDVDIYVGNPFRIESIAYSTNYEISQTIVVGNIPSTYGTISRY